jgi:ribosomal protein S13
MPTSNKKISEELMAALEAARDEGKDKFTHGGKTYHVEDFDLDEEIGELPNQKQVLEPNVDRVDKTSDDTVKKAGDATKKAAHNTAKGGAVAEGRKRVARSLDAGLITASVEEEVKGSIQEDIDALFNGEELTEGFKTKATAIFESAVSVRVKEIAETLEEEAEKKVAELVEEKTEELTTQVDEYLTYVAEEWVKENQVAVERGIRTDIAESFMAGLKSLFEAHHIEMPEEKLDVLAEQRAEIETLKGQLNKASGALSQYAARDRALQEATQAKETATAALTECNAALDAASKGLADTQSEQLRTLAEGIEFDTVGEFKQKLSVIKESYFGNGIVRSSNVLDEEETTIEGDDTVYATPSVAHYANFISQRSAQDS